MIMNGRTAVKKPGTLKGATTRANGRSKSRKGLSFPRVFTQPGVHPYDELVWEKRTASITNDKGESIFEQKDIEVPAGWSQLATNVVVSKYFHGPLGSPDREHSVRQLIDRVAKTVTGWGFAQHYFAADADAQTFEAELTHLLVNQKAAFNSPVWFNMGVEAKPQCSACFINSVQDTMQDILRLAQTEGMLFKYGSGTGTNLSTLRSSREMTSSGGYASGPVSFMKGYDAFAGVIKSGGKTRRAAKMVLLNDCHPDIVDFIECKAREEKKAWALIEAGYDGSFGGEAYDSVFFQNSNNSVRVSDEFLRAVVEDRDWHTRAVSDGRVVATYRARDLMKKIAECAHQCGDPGLQYDSTINEWHTCPNSGRINASNPCSEYVFLDDTACNLSSLNLMKFRNPDGSFDVASYKAAIRVMITAQEIIVDNASYPTERIGDNSHKYRPLGLGYANLGVLLMSRGLPYDSAEGRALAASLTAILTGEAYRQSAEIAQHATGAFEGYESNREPFLRVMRKHRTAVDRIPTDLAPAELLTAARDCWDEAIRLGEIHGFRNAQATVLAPTGTIGFMMDCDTTGIEPDIALVKYKKLSGGGVLKIVNRTVPEALASLGYSPEAIRDMVAYVDENGTIEGAPGLLEEHLPVFDCAFKPVNGVRTIHYMGHVRMMAAVQPFLSGAISKTVNMPSDATPDEISALYLEGWRQGLKAIAIYRDGCKKAQPLNTSMDKKKQAEAPRKPARRRLPDERMSITHKFSISGHEGYLTVGMYEDGTPGEIFVTMAKEGSVVSGLMDTIATMTSIALQYGVPIETLVKKFSHMRFEPSGFTNNLQIPMAKSVIDYIFRWLSIKFVPTAEGGVEGASAAAPPATIAPPAPARTGDAPSTEPAPAAVSSDEAVRAAHQKRVATEEKGEGIDILALRKNRAFTSEADAPVCTECGAIMVRNGKCYKCLDCGATSGCS